MSAALDALLRALDGEGHDFVTITPASHERVAARWRGLGRGLRDLFGWSRAVEPGSVPAPVMEAARRAGVIEERDGGVASTVRVSRLCGRLYLHSAWPTEAADSVFFGPDSYRFARLIEGVLGRECPSGLRVVEIGAGAGVGGIVAAELCPDARLTLTDVNAKALAMAEVNASVAGVRAELVETSGLDGLDGPFDLVLLNPPYIADARGRAYRDGGGELGTGLALELSREAAGKLAAGGRLLLYTGSPIVDGEDRFRAALRAAMEEADCALDYRELDPDIFGEELSEPAYATADRIALVGAVAQKRKKS